MTLTNILACAAFWLLLGTMWLILMRSWSGAYTAMLAALCWAEAQARVWGFVA